MSKQTGLGCALYANGSDLSGDTQSFTAHGGPAPLDVTDITQAAYGRLGGLRDGAIDWVSYMDPAAGASHAALSPLPTGDVIATLLIGPLSAGCPALAQVSKQVNYDPTRATDGMLTFAINGQANGFAQEWGISLTGGKRTDTSATTGAFFDNGAAFAFGAQAYFQVFAFTGTSAVIDIQHATTSGGAYTSTGLTTTSITTAPQAQRLATANNVTINEFLKVVTTGTFSSLVFAVMINVNPIAGVVF